MKRTALALLILCSAFGTALMHPLGGVWLVLGLSVYAAALWRYPGIALTAVLALLPLLDFALWSGWVLLNEFDLALAVTLAMRLLRTPVERSGPGLPTLAKCAVGGAAVSFLISGLIGLWPLVPLDANALFGPYTSWSSVRQLKGFLWALALLPLLIEEAQDPQRLDQRFNSGMILGLTGVVAVILWQRLIFAGLFDFAEAYRVEGPFPELHTGGGDVHAYLVAAIPFTVAWGLNRPKGRRLALAGGLFVLATYAVGVTFTRGGYLGYAVAFGVSCVALARYRFPAMAFPFGRIVAVGALTAIGLTVLLPIVSGSFMEARFSGTQAEATTRTRHWARAIAMMDKDVLTALFGMGLGSFPKTLLIKQPAAASASFGFERERNDGYLRLGSGRPLYLDQRITLTPGETSTVVLDMRSSTADASLDAMLCEKSIQYSFRCRMVRFRSGVANAWAHREGSLESGEIGSGTWPLRRPVALSLTNPRSGSVVDVTRVRLLDSRGGDHLVNGDFSTGGARWFFAADDHLPWHIFNLWVEILFEQGWLGVLAVAGLVASALWRSAADMWRGDLQAGVILAALAGFLAVGITESLFDGPRVTTLFFVVVLMALNGRPGVPGRCQPALQLTGDATLLPHPTH